MATKIRLKRGGRKGKPYYRIVVQDSRSRARGRDLDILGFYHPTARPEPMSEVDVHKSLDWLARGAQMTETARSILSRMGVLRYYHEGTRPEAAIATLKGQMLELKNSVIAAADVDEEAADLVTFETADLAVTDTLQEEAINPVAEE